MMDYTMSQDGQTSCTQKMNQSSPATRRQLRGRSTPADKDSGSKQAGNTDKDTPSSSSGIKMRTRLSTGTLIMNGTSTVKEKDIRTPPSTPSSDSPKSWKDNLSSASKRRAAGSSSSSESLAVIPPKLRKIVRKEGQEEGVQNDEYCWLCHKDEAAISCHLCPRSFHLKCLNMNSVAKEWVCMECAKIMQEEFKPASSKAVSQISTDDLCMLLRYALDRMRQPGSEIFQKPVDSADIPNYTDYIFHPMDFTMLERNIKNKEYGCTDAFLADAKWILHNCIIFNGVHHKLTTVARNVVKSCKHEMSEIEVCPQCYEHSCILTDGSWFVQPCDPPHTLVWAKLKGYPFWPAKALQEVNGQVDVRFFGAHDMSWIPVSQVFLLSEESPTATTKNRKGGFGYALEEMEEHVNILKEKCGGFDYAPYRTPYDRRHVYMNNKLKCVNRRFKSAGFVKIAIRGKEVEKVSAVSKTASALKSKYSTMATKKSSSIPSQGFSHQNRIFSSTTHLFSSSCESSPEKPARPAESTVNIVGRESGRGVQIKQTARKSLMARNPDVTMRNIIESKILKLQELDQMSTEEGKDDDGDAAETREDVVIVEKDSVSESDAKKISMGSSGSGSVTAKEMEHDVGEGSKVMSNAETKLLGREDGVDKGVEGKSREVVKSQCSELLVTNKHKDSTSVEGASKHSSGMKETSARELEKGEQSGTERKVEETPKSTGPLKGILPGAPTISKSLDASEDAKATVTKNTVVAENATKKNLPTTTTAIESSEKDNSARSLALSVVPASPTTPSSTGSLSSVPMEISPKSGVEYKHSLLKTIEACKGKLGISEVVDIEEVSLDVSEDDDDDEEDSGDSKEGGSASESTNRSTKTDGSVPTPADSEAASPAVISSEGKPDSDASPKSPANELGNSEKNVGLLQPVSSLEQPVSFESSTPVSAPGKDTSQKFLYHSPVVENSSDPGDGAISHPLTSKPDSLAASPKSVSQTGSDPVRSKLDPVSSKPVSQSGSHPLVHVAVSSKSISQSSSQNTCTTTTARKTLVETTKSEETDSVTTLSSSKPASAVSSNQDTNTKLVPSHVDKTSLPSSGASRVKPITIEDDDDEPGLLMEVETEEDEDSLIIDLEEEDYDLIASGSGSSRSDDFVRELAPSPSLVKSLTRRSQVNILRKNSKKQINKSDTVIPASASAATSKLSSSKSSSSSSAILSSSPPPSSTSAAPCVLVDVRSLSGMDHDWKVSESTQAKQARSKAQGQAQAEPQPSASPYPSAYTFHFKRPAAPAGNPVRQTQTVSSASTTPSPITTPTPTTSASSNSASSNSAPSNSASSKSAQKSRPGSSTEEGDGTDRQGLTAAAVSLVNKYSQQLISNTQIQLAEMCRELLATGLSEKESEQRLQEQRDQLQWTHEKQVAEIQHDFKMTTAEMKACWEAEKSKALSDLKKKLMKEKEEAVAETKKKQWCAHCWKEALYYCCWNTTYCSYTCQQSHWAVHQDTCHQAVDTTTTTTATTEPTTTSAEVSTAATSSTKSKEGENVGSNNGLSTAEAEERIKDDSWRSRLPLPTQTLGMGQSIHFLPAQQPAPPSSQPLQQLQYLHSLGPAGHTTFQTNSQVQLLSQRPTLNTMLPTGAVMPGNAMVFPILRNSQPGTLQGQPNVILNRPMHYQPLWKNC